MQLIWICSSEVFCLPTYLPCQEAGRHNLMRVFIGFSPDFQVKAKGKPVSVSAGKEIRVWATNRTASDRCKFHIRIRLDLRFKRHIRRYWNIRLSHTKGFVKFYCEYNMLIPHCGNSCNVCGANSNGGKCGDELRIVWAGHCCQMLWYTGFDSTTGFFRCIQICNGYLKSVDP